MIFGVNLVPQKSQIWFWFQNELQKSNLIPIQFLTIGTLSFNSPNWLRTQHCYCPWCFVSCLWCKVKLNILLVCCWLFQHVISSPTRCIQHHNNANPTNNNLWQIGGVFWFYKTYVFDFLPIHKPRNFIKKVSLVYVKSACV